MIRKRLRTILQVLFFLSLGLFLVWWMAKGISPSGWSQISQAIGHARYWVIFPVFVTLLISHYLRAMRWRLLIGSLNYKPSRFNLFSMVMIGYMSNLAIPRFGEILKCTLLTRYEKIPPEKLVGTIVAERAVDVLSLLIVTILTVLLQIDVVGQYTMELLKMLTGGEKGSVDLIKVLVFISVLLLLFFLSFLLYRHQRDKAWMQRIREVFKGVYAGLLSIRKVKEKRRFLIYSVVIWLLYMASIYIGFWALQETDELGIKEALAVLCFGSLGMLVPTQGGLGPYQYAVQKTLELYGIGAALGYAFGWILWLAQMGIVLFLGLICFILLPLVNRTKAAEASP